MIEESFKIAQAVLLSLGGGSLIIFAFSNWLGKVWADRLMTKEKAAYAQELESLRNKLTQETESYKIKLKKSEFIFQKEFEATSEFVSYKYSIIPTFNHPDMDGEDVLCHIAEQFDKIELFLDSFISQYGAIFTSEVKDYINKAKNIAGSEKFMTNDIGHSVYPDAKIDEANELYKIMYKIEEILIEQILSQSTT